MENDLLKNIPGLLTLLETKDFHNLTAPERALILRYWNEQEYNLYRQSVRSGKAVFDSEKKRISAKPDIKEKLLNQMQSGKTSEKPALVAMLLNMVSFRIPAYQPGFAIAILIFLFIFFRDKTPPETIRYLNRIDTVYLEKEVETLNPFPATVPVRSEVTVNKSGNSKRGVKLSDTPVVQVESSQIAERQNVYYKIGMVQKMSSGTTASHDSALLKFLVSAN